MMHLHITLIGYTGPKNVLIYLLRMKRKSEYIHCFGINALQIHKVQLLKHQKVLCSVVSLKRNSEVIHLSSTESLFPILCFALVDIKLYWGCHTNKQNDTINTHFVSGNSLE